MLTLSNFQIVEQIYESVNSIFYRGTRKNDNQSVILKMLKEDYPSPAELARYRQEFEITHNLDLVGVIKAYGIEKYKKSLVIIFEDFRADSLKQLAANRPLASTEFLPIAIQIADSLGDIHAADIIHKNINPNNILLNPNTKQLKIIDFGIASRLPNENLSWQNPGQLQGTLAYLSPEQTGRINRNIDYRTDLYSLGVTFYELLTGQLPFAVIDPLELVHCHIAKEPALVCEVNSAIPPIISDIVMKLLAKNPEDRFQSAFGVKSDLEKCQESIGDFQGPSGLRFVLGQNDFSGRFQIPQKLYGRDNEVAILFQAFERVSLGKAEMMLVAGYSGVGKTALVHEVHKPMTEKRGFFIAGKFDQFKKNIPYYALTQAFNQFCRYLLTENTEQLNQWREVILKSIGHNGQVLIEIIPQLELVIGKQPAVIQVGPVEKQNRFNFVFQNFIRAICQKDHPLVLFIDDLQWVDLASLNLLETLMMDASIQYFLIIGAYRDNEVGESHPLIVTINELQRTVAAINFLELANLQPTDVNLMLQDSLLCEAAHCQPLTELVYQKTQGNAFFTRQFLQTLYDDKLFHFDFVQHRWTWDIGQISTQNITDNVISLMVGKIDKLPEKISRILQLAACIGNQFDLRTLVIISGYDIAEISVVQTLLWQATREGLVQPLNENYEQVGISEVKPEAVSFKFLHDRVQQAAYTLIPDEGKSAIHLQTGRLMLKNYAQPTELEEKLFDIVNHLNMGMALIDTPEERVTVAELNLHAGKKASISSAHQAAVEYFTAALELLPTNAFQKYYDITFDIHKALAKSYYITNDFERSKKLYPIMLEFAQSTMDTVSVYVIQMEDYLLQGNYEKALKIQKDGVKLLGLNIPNDEGTLEKQIQEELQQVSKYLRGRNIADLVNAPEMESETHKAMLQMLMSMWITAYLLSRDSIVHWTSVKMCNLCLQHGNSELASFAYLQYGFVCIHRLQAYETGYQFGKVALKVADRYENLDIRGKVYFIFGVTINHWRKHVNLSTESIKKGYLFSVEAGDWTYAGYGAANIISNLLLAGHSCENTYKEAQSYLDFLQDKAGEPLNSFFTPGAFGALLNLLGKTKDKSSFDCEYFQEDTFYKTYHNLPIVMAWFYSVKIRSLYWFRCYDQGVKVIDQAETVANGVPLQIKVPETYFYSCLMLIAVDNQISDPEKKAYYWSLFDKYHSQMKIWAEHCPDNFQHKYLLVEAEKSRMLGKDVGTVLSLYEQAIQSAKEHHYPNNEALAHELTAGFWLSRGNESYAKIHLNEARYAYQLWGATAKVNDLEAQYSELLSQQIAPSMEAITARQPTSTLLDLESVMKASNILSGEIVLSRLLKKMMHTVIENAGATRGLLLLEKDGQWVIEAEGFFDVDDVTILQSLSIKECELVPATLIQYIARTQENVVLTDATQKGDFNQDACIIKHHSKSVLGMPLINQGKLTGILYLENNLTEGAFTPLRLEVLTLLSSQMAISIQNSLLYNNLTTTNVHLEQMVDERTRELQKTTEEAKTANQAKSEFLSNMSHELRTPMSAILGFSSIMSYDVDLLDHQKENLDIICRSGEHLLSLINDVLEMSKIEAGRTTLNKNGFDLYSMLESVGEIIRIRADAKDLHFFLEYHAELPQYIKTDEGKLRQILLNLLGNAIKFTKEGGVTLRAKAGLESRIDFEIEDSGIGIAEDEFETLFDPFVQTASGRRTQEGTGLGLSISRKYIQMMEGDIQVSSNPDQGSIFQFHVIVEPANLNEIVIKPMPRRVVCLEPEQHHWRILNLEDNPENQLLLSRLLQAVGFEVLEAANGKEGVERFKEEKFDFIFMDIRMPVMDGYEAVKQIREFEQDKFKQTGTLSHVPITALTASPFEEDRPRILSMGCDDFIRKPFQEAEIFEVISRHLGVRYVYEEEDVQEAPMVSELRLDDFSGLPDQWLTAFYKATVAGNFNALLEMSDQLEPAYSKLAGMLKVLIENFQFKKIRSLLGNFRESTEERK